jgi:hypothetical protein
LVSRATAIGLAAIGIGAGVLLACWGLSFFWHYDSPVMRKLEAMDQRIETMSHNMIEATDRKLDALDQLIETVSHKLVEDREVIDGKLDALDRRVAAVANRGFGGNIGDGHTVTGAVIKRAVTVFSSVKHEAGSVMTGWDYKDGASDGVPMRQFCYYTVNNLNGSFTQADIAVNGQALPNIGRVPRVEQALSKCQWWANS